jgi:hypothetical protein
MKVLYTETRKKEFSFIFWKTIEVKSRFLLGNNVSIYIIMYVNISGTAYW